MKLFKKIVLYLFLAFFVLAGTGILLVHVYSDEIKQAIIRELNKRIAVDIKAAQVNFTLFAKFPDASIELVDVTVFSSENLDKEDFEVNADTLLQARRLYLQFSLRDLYYKQYRMQRITVEDYDLRLFIDRNWENNFQLLEPDTVQEASVEFALDHVELQRGRIRYHQAENSVHISTRQKKLAFSGNFGADRYEMRIGMDGHLGMFSMDGSKYASGLDLETTMELNVEGDEYRIGKGRLRTGDMLFELQGTLLNTDTTMIQLHAEGRDLDVNGFLSLMPPVVRKYTGHYRSGGTFYFKADVEGPLGQGLSPGITAAFGVRDGHLGKTGGGYTIEALNLTGSYTNGPQKNAESSRLVLNNFRFSTQNSKAEGELTYSNFKQPHVRLKAKLKGRLEELAGILELEEVKRVSGHIDAELAFDGKTRKAGEFTAHDFRRSKTIGKLKLNDVELELKNGPNPYSISKGQFTFNNNNLRIDHLDVKTGANDMHLRGTLGNFMSWLFLNDGHLNAHLVAESSFFRVEGLLQGPGGQNGGSPMAFFFPATVEYSMALEIDEFHFWAFHANDVEASLYYRPQKLIAKNVSMNTMGGSISGQAAMAPTGNGRVRVQARPRLKNVDVQKLFRSFANFGQDHITEKHLRGTITASGRYAGQFTSGFTPVFPTIEAQTHVLVSNGELIGYTPLEALSEFIELEELRHIKFKTLENDIRIENSVVYIPHMEINTSAANITIDGEHSFDNNIDYRMKVYLQDILRPRKLDPGLAGQGYYIERTGDKEKTSLFLTLKGPIDDFKISYDAQRSRRHLGERIKDEGREFMGIIREEFNTGKKSGKESQGTEKKAEEEDSKGVQDGFVIEFGEENGGKPNPGE